MLAICGFYVGERERHQLARGNLGSGQMRLLSVRPSSQPPVSERELERYAGMWVLVRASKVVLRADSRDALMALIATRRVKDTDKICQLPVR